MRRRCFRFRRGVVLEVTQERDSDPFRGRLYEEGLSLRFPSGVVSADFVLRFRDAWGRGWSSTDSIRIGIRERRRLAFRSLRVQLEARREEVERFRDFFRVLARAD